MKKQAQMLILAVTTLGFLTAGDYGEVVFANHPEKTSDVNEPALTKQERIFGLVTIYRAAKQHFAYFDQVPDLDWDQTFMEFLPLVEKEQSLFDYYQTLRRFTVLLQDGHTLVTLPDSISLSQMTNLPLNLDYIEEQWVVLERFPTKEIVEEDIPPGSVVLAIESVPAKDYIEKEIFPFVPGGTFQGKSGLMNWKRFFPGNRPIGLKFKFRYPDGSVHSRSLQANNESNPIEFENMESVKKYHLPWNHPNKWRTNKLGDNIQYVRYGSCSEGVEDAFAKLIESMKQPLPKAMILDVRGNRGGSTPTKTVGHLISKPVNHFLFKTPCSISYVEARMLSASKNSQSREEIAKAIFEDFPEYSPGWYSFNKGVEIEPQENHYDGPLVILTNRMTSSAAEDLVVILQGNNRATVIGEPTHGSTGQPIFFDLPAGGEVQICTCLSLYPDGRSFVGVGIQPDILVKRTIQGIAEGRDEVLDAAMDYLNSVKNAKQVNQVDIESNEK